MTTVTLYHNPRCSKSRAAADYLAERQIETTVVRYLETPPSAETLRALYRQLQLSDPRQMMRTQDTLYQELALNNSELSEEALLDAIAKHPALLERPIAVVGERAAIGRPLENIIALL